MDSIAAEKPTERAAQKPAAARFPENLIQRFPRTIATYFSIDPRSLGLTRIYLGALLLYDLLRRVPGLATWYSNDGLLPNHTMLWRPSANWVFSFFLAASTPEEAGAMFLLCGICFFCLLIGYRTRLAHLASFACIVSLHSRAIFLENGGDVVLNLLCAWTMFLPMGARFSVDALTRTWRARREQNVAELENRTPLAPAREPILSLVVLAILVQLAIIYHFNAVHKLGQTWRRGTAVHYVLYQERMVTWLGWKVRPFVTLGMSRVMTYATLAIEAMAAPLILNPFRRLPTRRIAMLLLPGMHLAFALLLNVGMFSFNMIGFFPLLLAAADWDLFARWLGPQASRARTVYVDESRPLPFAVARLLCRLDAFGRLKFVAQPDERKGTASFEVEDTTGRRASGHGALTECARALPCGLLLAALLRVPGVARSARWVFSRLLLRRAAIVPIETPAAEWIAMRKAELREILVVVCVIAVGSQVLVENKAVPPILKLKQPPWMQQFVTYPRAFQGWAMFTPDVPTGERMIYVDALTTDGRHVDPFNQNGSRVSNLPVAGIPEFMDQNEFWCDYTNRIPENRAYWEALKAWIFAYHHRTGRENDRVLSFELRSIEVESPAPGEKSSKNIRAKLMLNEVAVSSN